MRIPEKLLHFIWRFRLFDQYNLQTLQKDDIKIQDVGHYNLNAGPDFLHAKIKIGKEEWNGHVELHVTDKAWYQHRHDKDKSYDNVILHVVWDGDEEVSRSDGTAVPTLCLKPLIRSDLITKYEMIMGHSNAWIPCEKHISNVDPLLVRQYLSRMAVERFHVKSDLLINQFTSYGCDFEKMAFVMLARAFGQKVNADTFQELAELIPFKLIHKYRDDLIKSEALFLGIAGFLGESEVFKDSYAENLRGEYQYLRKLHGLPEMDKNRWKFMRMRPYNFPTFRIVQLVSLYRQQEGLFSYIIELGTLADLKLLFEKIKLSEFWERHYTLQKSAVRHTTKMGEMASRTLIINSIVQLLFLYGKYFDQEMYICKAMEWLEEMEAESNSIVRSFAAIGVTALCAADSQALIHLKSHYCALKKCLDCQIGLQILKPIRS
ncbi:DUF2851 family protein [Sphingobacterium spiritivorum]|uniref:DUF2851 family protein n=1 Tax=Sphingobacterium spiritivorum TaxID=258 RepID=UPI00191A5979|nr:DUF2851 family protein [Sphingobacterium spiritivorum]QQT25065.1 DUF2851 family protein [Sphingobacterium spiritivorum]